MGSDISSQHTEMAATVSADLKCSILLVLIGAALCDVEPDQNLCKNRESHWKFGGKNYIYSGKSKLLANEKKETVTTGAKGVEFTAGEATDWCKQRCMGLVALESQEEWDLIRNKMEGYGAPFIWTSGHICDRESGGDLCYTVEELQPRIINGWYWSSSGVRINSTDRNPAGWSENPWGKRGIYERVNEGKPTREQKRVNQPDNAEQRLNLLEGKEESCLALATGLWEPTTVWNDIACYHRKEWMCEDNPKLLKQFGLKG